MVSAISSFALEKHRAAKPNSPYIDESLETLIRSPLTSLLPNLIFSVNLLVETYGNSHITFLPALSASLLPMISAINSIMSSIPPSRKTTCSAQVSAIHAHQPHQHMFHYTPLTLLR
jgi:hypothetical protein